MGYASLRFTSYLRLVAALMAIFPLTASADRVSHLRRVVTTDQSLSPQQPTTSIGLVSRAVINSVGHTAFTSESQGSLIVWREAEGELKSRPAPEPSMGDLYLMDDDSLIFRTSDGPYKPGIWLQADDSMQQLAGRNLRPVDEAGEPIAGLRQRDSYLGSANRSGDFAFIGTSIDAAGATVAGGVYQGTGTDIRLVMPHGGRAPGTPDGMFFVSNSDVSSPRVNSLGQVVFAAGLEGPALIDSNRGIWTTRSGELQLLYRDGDLIPGGTEGDRFQGIRTRRIGEPSINDQGDIVFISGIATASGAVGGAVFADRDGRLDQIAATGQPIPGRDGLFYSNATLGDVVISNGRQVAFTARTSQTTDAGLFVERSPGQVEVVAIRGDEVPGLPGSELQISRNLMIQLNSRGQVAFSSNYDVGRDRFTGAFVFDVDGQLKPVLLPGDQIEVREGDVRVVTHARVSTRQDDKNSGGNAAGQPSYFNERGQLLLSVIFADRTRGLFVSDMVALILDGDFDGDTDLDVGDIDQLLSALRTGSGDHRFDVTGDGQVDESDVNFWVHDLKQTYFGDVDLDGQFSSTDLVTLFAFGQFEDDIVGNSTWATGDWDGDAEFTSSDLVFALKDGGYEQGPRAVPEPSGIIGSLIGIIAVLAGNRRHRSHQSRERTSV